MGWLSIEESTFYGAVWTVAFLVSLSRCASATNPQPIRVSIFASSTAGFLAFAIIAVRVGSPTTGITNHMSYVGLATLIGASGPLQEMILVQAMKNSGLIAGKLASLISDLFNAAPKKNDVEKKEDGHP